MNLENKIKTRINESEMKKVGAIPFTIPTGMKFLKPDRVKPAYEFDFVPFICASTGEAELFFSYKKHDNIGMERKSFVCPRTVNKECAICDYLDGHINNTNYDELKKFKPKESHVYNLYSREHKSMMVYQTSNFLFTSHLLEEANRMEDFTFANLENGKTAQVWYKEEVFMKVKFYPVAKILFKDREPFKTEVIDRFKKYALDFSSLIIVPAEEEVEKLKNIIFNSAPKFVVNPAGSGSNYDIMTESVDVADNSLENDDLIVF